MLQSFTLNNGLKVATLSNKSLNGVYLSISARAGFLFEGQQNRGMAHFIEHIIAGAIPCLPSDHQVNNFIEQIGGSLEAYTDSENVRITLNAPRQYLENCLKVLSEMFFEPLFSLEEIERERQAIIAEISKRDDFAYLDFAHKRFTGEHLLKISTSLKQVIDSCQREDLVNYWASYFFPSNTFLVLTGNFDDKEIKTLVGNYFNKYSSDKKFKGYPHFDNSSFSDLAVFFSPIPRVKTCRIALTFPGSYKEVELQDCIIQQLLKRIMTGSPNSRLRKVLRYDTGLVYEVTTESVRYQLFGYIDITTQTDPQNLFRVVDAIIQSLLYLKAFGPTEEEYESAKNHHINRVLIDDDRPDYVLEMMREALMNKGVVSTEDYIELVKSLDINLVKPFIDKYWNFSKANLIVSGFVTDSVENRMILLNLLRKLSI